MEIVKIRGCRTCPHKQVIHAQGAPDMHCAIGPSYISDSDEPHLECPLRKGPYVVNIVYELKAESINSGDVTLKGVDGCDGTFVVICNNSDRYIELETMPAKDQDQ